jgi:putative FmdB family regulatory protein
LPTYDYECRNCGHRVEVLHGVNDPGPTACHRCGGAMRKLLSAPSIHFKGSGWAKKDRSAGPAAKAGAGSEKRDGEKRDGSETSAGSEAPAKGSETSTGAGKKDSSAASPAD